MVDDRHTVAETVRLLHVVGGDQDGLPLGDQLVQDLPQGQSALRVQTRGGFVEEEHRRTVEDGPGEQKTLRHTARQDEDRGRGPPREVEPLQELVGPSARLVAGNAEQQTVEVEVLPHRQ